MSLFMAYYVHQLSPFIWEFGNGWGIRYYGLAYLLGFLAFYAGMVQFYKWGWSSLRSEQVADLLTWLIIGILIGGRLGYCLVYDWNHTLADPLSIIAFWRGGISGMSSHGGMVGAIAALYFYARRAKTDFWVLADHAAILTTVGFFLGRVANFINGELWGRPSYVPWAVIFSKASFIDDGAGIPRHPSQLYEAFGEGLLLGIILFLLRRQGWSNGKVGISFLILYGVIRIIMEMFREPDEGLGFLFGGLTMGQWLSVGLVIGGGILWILRSRKG